MFATKKSANLVRNYKLDDFHFFNVNNAIQIGAINDIESWVVRFSVFSQPIVRRFGHFEKKARELLFRPHNIDDVDAFYDGLSRERKRNLAEAQIKFLTSQVRKKNINLDDGELIFVNMEPEVLSFLTVEVYELYQALFYAGANLVIEITERNIELLDLRSVYRLFDLGVEFALDDFDLMGQHLDFSLLANECFRFIKIELDMALQYKNTVSEIRESFGKEVIVERVEFQESMLEVMTLHCDYLQGYLLADPQLL